MVLTLSLGILLAAGAVAAVLARWVGLPRVTFYILAGMLVGPSVLHWVPLEHLHEFDPVLKLALAVVLLEIGSRIRLDSLRRIVRVALPLSAGELAGTFVFVSAGTWLIGATPEVAVLLGALALATAPATTIVVLREYDSEGPVTSYCYLLVAANNLAAIVLFELLLVLVLLLGDGAGPVGNRLGWLAVDVFGSVLLGVLAGLVVSLLSGRFAERQRTLIVFAVTTLLLGLCEWIPEWVPSLHAPYLLTFLAMGVTLANTSSAASEVVRGLDPVAALLYVVFFVAAGAELNLPALWLVGPLGAAYVASRCAGKYFGTRTAAWLRNESPGVQRWLGAALIAQAGAAIGLVKVAAERDPALGGQLQTIIVGTIVFFEVVGPILTRLAVVRAGEVPLAHLVQPERPGWREAWRELVGQFRESVGRERWGRRPRKQLQVGDLMRQNVEAVSNGASFVDVLEFIEHSRHQVYPVTDDEGGLVGVIRYRDIRTILFGRDWAPLVRAHDLCVPARNVLHAEQSIEDAFEVCERTADDVIPVVSADDNRRLLGLVERRDVVRFVKSRYQNENSA